MTGGAARRTVGGPARRGGGDAAAPRYVLAVGMVTAAVVGALVALALTATAPVPGIPGPGIGVTVALNLARVVLDLAAVITVGVQLLPMLVGPERLRGAELALRASRPVAVGGALVWAVAALATLLLETVDYAPARPLSAGLIGLYIRHNAAGQALLAVAGLALILAVLGVVTLRAGESMPYELRLFVGLLALLPLPATGHAADATGPLQDIALISIALHVVAATAWTGGLLVVVATLWASRGLLATTLPRFSRLAAVCLLAVTATGLFNGWFELYRTPGVHWYLALFNTGYGLVVLGKVSCAVVLAAMGGHIRFRLLPVIARHGRTGLLGWAAAELAVMGLAFGLAAVLVRAPVVG